MERVVLLKDIGINDSDKVGRFGINLSILHKKRFNVPPAFILSKQFYDDFFEFTGIEEKIFPLIQNVNQNNVESYEDRIKNIIISAKIPDEMKEEIIDAYYSLSFDIGSNDASSLLKVKEEVVNIICVNLDEKEEIKEFIHKDIKGEKELLESIKQGLSIPFSPSSIMDMKGRTNEYPKGVAFIIQRKINPEKSGNIKTINGHNSKEMQISVFRPGTKEEFETAIIDKITLETKGEKLNNIKPSEIMEISRIGKRIEGFMGTHQKIEWTIYKNQLLIVQMESLSSDSKEEINNQLIMESYGEDDQSEPLENDENRETQEKNHDNEDQIIDIEEEKEDDSILLEETQSDKEIEKEEDIIEEDVEIIDPEPNIDEDIEFLEIIEKEEANSNDNFEAQRIKNDEEKESKSADLEEDLSIFSSLKESKPDFEKISTPEEDIVQKALESSKETFEFCINAIRKELEIKSINSNEELINSEIENKTEISKILLLDEKLKKEKQFPEPKDIEIALTIINELKK